MSKCTAHRRDLSLLLVRPERTSSISTLSPDLFLYPINKQTMAASIKKRSDPLWASLASGTIAGAVEGAVTYPADFVKTQVQFHGQSGAKVSLPLLLL